MLNSQKFSKVQFEQSRGRHDSKRSDGQTFTPSVGDADVFSYWQRPLNTPPHLNINQTLILLCGNESVFMKPTDIWSKGPLRHAQVRLRPAEKQLWSFLSEFLHFFIPNVQDAFCVPEHPKSLSCMYVYTPCKFVYVSIKKNLDFNLKRYYRSNSNKVLFLNDCSWLCFVFDNYVVQWVNLEISGNFKIDFQCLQKIWMFVFK